MIKTADPKLVFSDGNTTDVKTQGPRPAPHIGPGLDLVASKS